MSDQPHLPDEPCYWTPSRWREAVGAALRWASHHNHEMLEEIFVPWFRQNRRRGSYIWYHFGLDEDLEPMSLADVAWRVADPKRNYSKARIRQFIWEGLRELAAEPGFMDHIREVYYSHVYDGEGS